MLRNLFPFFENALKPTNKLSNYLKVLGAMVIYCLMFMQL